MDPLALLEKYRPVLQLRDLTFDEKVGYITAQEHPNSPVDKISQHAGSIRSVLLGYQNERLHEAARRQPPPTPIKSTPSEPKRNRAKIQQDIDEVNVRLNEVISNFDDPNTAENLKLLGRRLEVLKGQLARC